MSAPIAARVAQAKAFEARASRLSEFQSATNYPSISEAEWNRHRLEAIRCLQAAMDIYWHLGDKYGHERAWSAKAPLEGYNPYPSPWDC